MVCDAIRIEMTQQKRLSVAADRFVHAEIDRRICRNDFAVPIGDRAARANFTHRSDVNTVRVLYFSVACLVARLVH